jgi:L-fuconolactonase
MIVDAHQHFWSLSRGDYAWLTPDLGSLYRDYLPPDLDPVLQATKVKQTILVQATPTNAETTFLLELAGKFSWIAGVVGWTDLIAPDAPVVIEKIATHAKLVGLRPMLHIIDDDDWILGDRVTPALEAMTRAGLCFDAVIRPQQIKVVETLLHRHPNLKLVVDHAANPPVGENLESWADDIRHLASMTRAFCKLSGLITRNSGHCSQSDLRRVFDVVIDAFGPRRLMWGSDWPVLNLAGSYEDWIASAWNLTSELSPTEQRYVMSQTATEFYLQPRSEPTPRGRHR